MAKAKDTEVQLQRLAERFEAAIFAAEDIQLALHRFNMEAQDREPRLAFALDLVVCQLFDCLEDLEKLVGVPTAKAGGSPKAGKVVH